MINISTTYYGYFYFFYLNYRGAEIAVYA